MRVPRTRLLLPVGFALLGIGTVLAYTNPATGYEVSIYAGTPLAVWLCYAAAILLSVPVVFSAADRRTRGLGALLGGLGMTTTVSLPVVRGYHYLDESDALSHMGVARDMAAGVRPLTESRYPLVQTLGVAVQDATGLALRHAMLLLVVVFVVAFFLSVPLVARKLTGDSLTTRVALYSGLLLLPINHLSPSHRIHPTTQAIMFAPAFLLAFLAMYRRHTLRRSLVFLLLAPAFVLLHPQQAANLVAFLGTVAVLQVSYDFFTGRELDRIGEWVLPEVTLYGVCFWLWTRQLPVFRQNSEQVIETVAGDLSVAGSTAARSGSLQTVGGSLPEVFLKLFLVTTVYIALTGVVGLVVYRRFARSGPRPPAESVASDGGRSRILLLSVFAGLVPVGLLFALYLLGGISDQYFRHLGMLSVFATVLGAVGLGLGARYLAARRSPTAARASLSVVLVVFLALSLPVVFVSPYVYDSSNHVPEAQIDGYDTTFEHAAATVPFDDVRSPVFRYWHALRDSDRGEATLYYRECTAGIPDHFNDRSLRSYYVDPVYVPVTRADRVRDGDLWNGFRFSRGDFAYLEAEPGVDRVQANGAYTLYRVEPEDDSRQVDLETTCTQG